MADVGVAALEAALRAGVVFDGGAHAAAGQRPTLDATMLRHYLTDRSRIVDPFGIRLVDVDVVGQLSAEALDVPFPLSFERCRFEQPIELNGSSLHALSLLDCDAPALVGNGLRLRRNLTINGSRLDGGVHTQASTSYPAALWLCEADIGGRLTAVGTVLRVEQGRAMQADGMHVRGGVRMIQGCRAHGEVRLISATIGGVLDLSGSWFTGQGRWALNLAEAQIVGSLLLVRDSQGQSSTVAGGLNLEDTRIGGQLIVRDAVLGHPTTTEPSVVEYLGNRSQTCLSGPRLQVDGAVLLADSTVCGGLVDLSLSQMSTLTIERDVHLRAPEQVALDLSRATIRGEAVFGGDLEVEGTIAMSGARIGGDLRMYGLRLSRPANQSLLRAPGIQVDGMVDLRKAQVDGGSIRLVDAAIAGTIELGGAQLTHHTVDPDQTAEGQTLNLRSARVRGSVRLVEGFASHGQVILTRAEVEGWLECDGGTFVGPDPTRDNPDSDALTAISARVVRGLYLTWTRCSPSADLSSLETTLVSDDPATAPSRLVLAGLTYDRFTRPRNRPDIDPWNPRRRLEWLARQPELDEGAYEQAARVYARHGRIPGAETILMAQREQARKLLLLKRPWVRAGTPVWWRQQLGYVSGWWYGRLFGYGYRPLRAVAGIVGLLAAVVVVLQVPAVHGTLRAADSRGNVYAPDGRVVTVSSDQPAPSGAGTVGLALTAPWQVSADSCGGGQVRCFDPVLFAVDTVVPLVTLDQRSTWYVDPQTLSGRLVGYLLGTANLLGWVLSTTLVLSLARLSRTLQS
jgi:hypothetical protein